MTVRPWHLFGVIVAFGVGPAVWIGGSLVSEPASGTTPAPVAVTPSESPSPSASPSPTPGDDAGDAVPPFPPPPLPASSAPASSAAPAPATPATPTGAATPTAPADTGTPRPGWSIILPPLFPDPDEPPDEDR